MTGIKLTLLFIVCFIQLIPFIRAEDSNVSQEDDDSDYVWNFLDEGEKPKHSKEVILSLTRDWFYREDPDRYPSNGFFPIWFVALMVIAAFFFLLAILAGVLDALGCKGRNPVVQTVKPDRKASILIQDHIRKNQTDPLMSE